MSAFPAHLSLPKTNIFIETGTANARSSILAIENGYTTVHTMDIQKQVNPDNLMKKGDIRFYHESSLTALPKILENIHERSTFWLDAHPNDFKARDWPLLKELDIIRAHEIKNHNILIDDIDIVFNCGLSNHIINILTSINESYRLNMRCMSQIRALDTFIAITDNIPIL